MTNVSRAYAGEYVCNADNGVGSQPVRRVVRLNVLYPPEVGVETGWVHAGAGETVVLVCRVYSNPVATVTWYKHTMKLIQGDRISTQQVGNTHKLTIAGLTSWDYG